MPETTETKFFIETYGCQMNEYDSLIVQNILEKNKVVRVTQADQANMILLNTCAIRENAHEKVYNRLRSLEYLRKKGAKIGVLGCMSQNLKEDLLYENLPIDFIVGPDSLRELPTYFSSSNEQTTSHLKLSKTETYDDLTPSVEHHLSSSKNKITAFVSIQRGCDNFCSFCVVPFTRGRERSRDFEGIISEIEELSKNGFKSVVLLGQNVNSYLYQGVDFHGLTQKILKNTHIARIYFTSPHPKDFPKKLLDLMANESRFCNQIHLPLQSGSNQILEKMRRGYTRESFLRLVDIIRNKVHNVAISTDVIVGFPKETKQQFEETLSVMDEVAFDHAYMFAYSKRKGTSASKLYSDDITKDEKQRRLNIVIQQQQSRSLKKNQTYIGRSVPVLVEGYSRKSLEDFTGSLENGKKVVFKPESETKLEQQLGKIVYINIHAVTSNTLLGSIKKST